MTSESSGSPQALVERMAKALVDSPGEVSVELPAGSPGLVELRVAQPDMGKVIGKNGRTARAMRAILGAAGSKRNQRFNLEIVE